MSFEVDQLKRAGITWRVYQEGLGWNESSPMSGNYDDNALANFRAFADAATDSELHQHAMRPAGVDQLRSDVLAGRLPQVSWIVTPAAFSEHPSYPPASARTFAARARTVDRALARGTRAQLPLVRCDSERRTA